MSRESGWLTKDEIRQRREDRNKLTDAAWIVWHRFGNSETHRLLQSMAKELDAQIARAEEVRKSMR
jgi:hypothetical protein